MATPTQKEQSSDLEQKVQKLRELYADASEIGKTALENVIRALKSSAPAKEPAAAIGSAGRIGRRQGKVSELTVIVPMAPGGARRLRGFLTALHGSIGNELVDRVGTVHDMRFVFLDNDTKLLFCTAYDGDWDAYINDFATMVPEMLDFVFEEVDGCRAFATTRSRPRISSPRTR